MQNKLKTDHKIDAYVDTTRTDSTTVQFPERLMQAIVDNKVFICLLGDGTLDSEWVLKEIEQAYNIRKRCLPVFQEGYVPPEKPSEAVKYLLNFDGIHIFDVKNIYMDEAVANIAQLVEANAKKQSFKLKPALSLAIVLVIAVFAISIMLQAFKPSVVSPEAQITANYYNDRGAELLNADNYAAAIEEYNLAIELDPNHVNAYLHRGISYAKLENYEAAIADYTRVIELDPTNALAFNNRGISYFEQENYNMAINDYSQAMQLEPGRASFQFNRGLAYYDSGNYEAALTDWLEAERLGYTFTGIHIQYFDELRATVTPNP